MDFSQQKNLLVENPSIVDDLALTKKSTIEGSSVLLFEGRAWTSGHIFICEPLVKVNIFVTKSALLSPEGTQEAIV